MGDRSCIGSGRCNLHVWSNGMNEVINDLRPMSSVTLDTKVLHFFYD